MNRKDIVTTEHFLREYHKYSAADYTLSAFDYKGIVYAVRFDKTIPKKLIYRTYESGTHDFKLRINWKVAYKQEYIKNGKAVPMLTYKELKALPYSKNEGFKFEGYIANLYAEENKGWHPSNDRFDKCGDVVINGEQVQVKFGNASLTNIKALHNVQDDHRRKKIS